MVPWALRWWVDAMIGKRLKNAREGIDRSKLYELGEAVEMVKSRANTKFDETVEVAMNLGVDPRHADQMVRGVVQICLTVPANRCALRCLPKVTRQMKQKQQEPIL